MSGNIELVELDDPTPGPSEVVLRVEASGMCGSDLHIYRGPQRVPTGRSPVTSLPEWSRPWARGCRRSWIGRAVMVHHYFGCGVCDQCQSGWTQMCREGASAMGNTADGSHADLVKVPFDTILALPDGLSHLASAAISCGTGTAWGALERLGLGGADTIAIFGQGPVGLAATQLAAAMGARVIALDISAPSTRTIARDGRVGDRSTPRRSTRSPMRFAT